MLIPLLDAVSVPTELLLALMLTLPFMLVMCAMFGIAGTVSQVCMVWLEFSLLKPTTVPSLLLPLPLLLSTFIPSVLVGVTILCRLCTLLLSLPPTLALPGLTHPLAVLPLWRFSSVQPTALLAVPFRLSLPILFPRLCRGEGGTSRLNWRISTLAPLATFEGELGRAGEGGMA